jgi:hypothetical protein
MTPESIFNKVQDILQDSSYLAEIVDGNIFLGARESISMFPCIVIESNGDRLLDESFQNEGRVLGVNIIFYMRDYNKETQITEEWRIANLIRKAISADITLGLADVYDTRFLSEVTDLNQYPIRGHAINIEIHYKQNRLTRV